MYDKLHRVAVNSGYAAIIQANQLKRMRNRDGKKKSSARLRSWPRCNWLQFFLFIFVSDVQVFFFFYICALPFRSSVAIFFSSTANHLCHPYESMMNYRRPHYYAPVFFSSNKYIVTFLPFQLKQRATNTTQYGSMNGIALHHSRTSQFDDSFFSSHSICAALLLLL